MNEIREQMICDNCRGKNDIMEISQKNTNQRRAMSIFYPFIKVKIIRLLNDIRIARKGLIVNKMPIVLIFTEVK